MAEEQALIEELTEYYLDKYPVPGYEQLWNEPGSVGEVEWHGILEFIHRLARSAEDQADRLQAIVDTLPKCWRLNDVGELVQDCPVVLGMTVWLWCSFGDGQPRQIHEMVVFGVIAVAASDGGRDGTTMHRWAHKDSYSSREAAEVRATADS